MLDCSVAPSVQPGPCQRPCHICLGPVPAANQGSHVTKAGSSWERQVSATSPFRTPPPLPSPLPPHTHTFVEADACCNRALYLKLSSLERRVICATHSQSPYRKRPQLHQLCESARVRYEASTRGDCPGPKALQTGAES